jgi:hypothetical protein
MTAPVPAEARIQNLSDRRFCRWCGNTGYVVVQLRTDKSLDVKRKQVTESGPIEEMGPCPFCEQGYTEEFGDAENQQAARPVKPPWKLSEGFWKGRDVREVQPLYTSTKLLPPAENRRRMRELARRMGVIGREVEE